MEKEQQQDNDQNRTTTTIDRHDKIVPTNPSTVNDTAVTTTTAASTTEASGITTQDGKSDGKVEEEETVEIVVDDDIGISTRASTPQTSLCSPPPSISNMIPVQPQPQLQQEHVIIIDDKNTTSKTIPQLKSTQQQQQPPTATAQPQPPSTIPCVDSSVEVSLSPMLSHSPSRTSPPRAYHNKNPYNTTITTDGSNNAVENPTLLNTKTDAYTNNNVLPNTAVTSTPTSFTNSANTKHSKNNNNIFNWDDNQHDTPTASGVKSCVIGSTTDSSSSRTRKPNTATDVGLPYLLPPNYEGETATTSATNNNKPFHGGLYRNSSFYSTSGFGGAGFSLTSSTRSVKSLGSSIVDTDLEHDPFLNDGNTTAAAVIPQEVISVHETKQQQPLPQQTQPSKDGGEYIPLLQMLATRDNGMMKSLEEVKTLMTLKFREMEISSRKEVDRVVIALQQESSKRSALEARMHSQLLLQAETMVAMEVKLLRLESKVEKREAASRRRYLSSSTGAGGFNFLSSSVMNSGLSGVGVGGAVGATTTNSGESALRLNSGVGGVGIGGGGGTIGGIGSGSTVAALATPTTPTATSILLSPDPRLTLPTISAIYQRPHDTIDEEENDFETMEIQVTSPNPHHNQHNTRTNKGTASNRPPNPTNIAVVSSGVSLASAVTEETHDVGGVVVGADRDDEASARSDDGDVEDEGDGEASTPTQGSRNFTNLESILLNPINAESTNEEGMSTRATRGDHDASSSLATSVTNTTLSSTVVTATTRGGDSINPRSSLLTQDETHLDDGHNHNDEVSNVVDVATSTSPRGPEDVDSMFAISPPPTGQERPRSRSQSPLTVQSGATTSIGPSIASASLGTSILSTAAVAPTRSFRARRDAAARMLGVEGRPLADRVVSFTSNEVFSVPPEISEAGDSITMPDELDNLSDVADAFADRARLWRDEYEARLDAIQKRWVGE